MIIEPVFQLFCEFENEKLGRGMYVNVSTFMSIASCLYCVWIILKTLVAAICF